MNSGLIGISTKLPVPKNYFKGTEYIKPILPQNILMFTKGDASILRGPDQHYRCLLIYSLKGSGEILLDNQHFYLKENQSIFVMPHQYHQYINIDQDKYFWLFLSFEYPELSLLELLKNKILELTESDLEYAYKLVTIYNEELINNHNSGLLNYHLAILLENLKKISSNTIKANNSSFLSKVNKYIYLKINKNISVIDIAESVGLSESYLRAKFKKLCNESIGNYIKKVKLHRASVFLKEGDVSISELASDCGFESIYSFSRAFKNVYGFSPKKYSKRNI